ncbi:hypothetical protein G6705_08580, partial [Polynucleobacter paneuropaeus]|nr:hypothetical protein [Polynucleobacter paneuropaeus]
AALGINLNATYNSGTSYSSTINTKGLVGGDTVTSVTINNANVAANESNYITGVTGTTGAAGTTGYDFLQNYTINNKAYGSATTGNPGTTDTNTITLSKAALGINLNATYNGTTSYDNGIQTNGLQVNDSIASVTINNANVAANGTNYIKSVTGTTGGNSSTDLTTNYTITLNAKSGDATTGTPTTKTDNTVTLSKAALGINLNATYN